KEQASELAHLSKSALSEMGVVLGMVTGTLQKLFQPEHIHTCRFGHDLHHTVHFHVIPIYGWLRQAYDRIAQEGGTKVRYPKFTDGASLTLFVSEEFRNGRTPCEIPPPNISDAISALRKALSKRN